MLSNKELNVQLIMSILMALMIVISAAIFMMKSKNNEIRGEEICWVNSNEITAWHNINTTQKVGRIIFGLRRDGIVVWREEKLNGSPTSCIFFEKSRCGETSIK